MWSVLSNVLSASDSTFRVRAPDQKSAYPEAKQMTLCIIGRGSYVVVPMVVLVVVRIVVRTPVNHCSAENSSSTQR